MFTAALSLFALAPLSAEAQDIQTLVRSAGEPLFSVRIPGFAPLPVDERLFQIFMIVFSAVFVFAVIFGIVFLALSALRQFHTIPRDKAISFGWNAIRNAPFVFIGIAVLHTLISNILNIILNVGSAISPAFIKQFQSNDAFVSGSIVIGFLLSTYATAGIISVALAYIEQKKIVLRRFFISPSQAIQIFIGTVVYLVGISVGALLFVLPAVWFGSTFFFWPYIVLQKNTSFIRAFQESARMAKGARFEIFLFWFLSQALIFLGLLIVGIGYLITFPLVMFASAYLYMMMSGVIGSAEVMSKGQHAVKPVV
jgi:hypothetical protein